MTQGIILLCIMIVAGVVIMSNASQSGTAQSNRSTNLVSDTIRLPDGRSVTCVRHAGYTAVGGVTCDWVNAK